MRQKTVKLLNVQVNDVLLNDLVEQFREGMLLTLHVDMLAKLQNDHEFYSIVPEFNLVVCDSQILYLASKFLGEPLRERVSGSDFFPLYYERYKADPSVTIFLCGGKDGVAERARENINRKVGRNMVVGAYAPTFDFDSSPAEMQRMISAINESRATVLVVGLGAGRQEKFIVNHKKDFQHVKLFLPLGGALDYEAGALKRPASWITSMGLEWLYRLLKEPSARWYRYLVHQPPVLWLLLKQKCGRYRNPFALLPATTEQSHKKVISLEPKNSKIRVGLVGFGKMGISHASILRAQKDVDLAAIADSSVFLLPNVVKMMGIPLFKDYKSMFEQANLDAVVIATPTQFHAEVAHAALEQNLHVFVEKPFVINLEEGKALTNLAESKNLVNQVGYHNRFIGTFLEAKRLVETDVLGQIVHIHGEAYGQVVVSNQGATWRSAKGQGGGCLRDYTSHLVDLMNFIVGPPKKVLGCALSKIYSKWVDDAVFATLDYGNGMSGQISTNWCDETYRKMTTQVTIQGLNGKLIVDRQECKLYLNDANPKAGFAKGWTIRYITELQQSAGFYLRGEEYSLQIEEFVKCIKLRSEQSRSSFKSALQTDLVIDDLLTAGTKESEYEKNSVRG